MAQLPVSWQDQEAEANLAAIQQSSLPVQRPVEAAPMPTQQQPPLIDRVVGKLLGTGGQDRYQLWPEKIVRDALDAPNAAMTGRMPMWQVVDGELRTSPEAVKAGLDMSALAGTGGLGGVAAKPGEAILGIVPVAQAKSLKVKSSPPSDILKAAVENTPGAKIDADGHLIVNVSRNQHPDQEMSEALRGGVFYLPKGSKDQKYYSGKNENFAYGGDQRIEGETAYLNPLVVKGATGGKAPEAAYDSILGKGSYQKMRDDALHWSGGPKNIREEAVSKFLNIYAPELEHLAGYIIDNSTKGNQLAYALQEAAVASQVRKAGHDGVIGYSELRGTDKGKQRISEIFDVRENRYPAPEGDYSIHPEFYSDSALPGMAIASQRSKAFLRPALKYKDKLYKGKPDQQHLDVIPPELVPEFQRMAMSGEDISHYNFGFVNHKGHFLDREAALKYAIDEGLMSPHDAKFGALTSTMELDDPKVYSKTPISAQTKKLNEIDDAIAQVYSKSNRGSFENPADLAVYNELKKQRTYTIKNGELEAQ